PVAAGRHLQQLGAPPVRRHAEGVALAIAALLMHPALLPAVEVPAEVGRQGLREAAEVRVAGVEQGARLSRGIQGQRALRLLRPAHVPQLAEVSDDAAGEAALEVEAEQ